MLLQVEPELCTRPKRIADPPRKVGRDRTVAAQDLCHSLRRKAERPARTRRDSNPNLRSKR